MRGSSRPNDRSLRLPGGDEPREPEVPRLLWTAGVTGFVVSALLFPNWQGALEPAQMLAGVVDYPHWNPHYRFGAGTWTMLSQISALAITAGAGERALAVVLAGLGGTIWFAALSLIGYGVSRRLDVGLLAPFLLLAVHGPVFAGVTYPVMVLGTTFTYGTVAMGWALLVLGLFAVHRWRWGSFALALMPAVHVSTAAWLFAALAVVAFRERGWARQVAGAWRFFGAGLALTLASLASHLVTRPTPLDLPAREAWFVAAMKFWEGHRQPFAFTTVPMAATILGMGTAAALLRAERGVGCPAGHLRHGGDSPEPAGLRVLALAIISCAAVGLLFSVVYWLPQERMPSMLVALMPSRILNVPTAVATVLLVAGLSRERGRGTAGGVACAALLSASSLPLLARSPAMDAVVSRIAPGWRWLTADRAVAAVQAMLLWWLLMRSLEPPMRRRLVQAAASAALLLAFVLSFEPSVSPAVWRYSTARLAAMSTLVVGGLLAFYVARRPRPRLRADVNGRFLFRLMPLAPLIAAALVFVAHAFARTAPRLEDRSTDSFWKTVSEGRGAVITGPDVSFVQLRARRPVLLDGTLLDYLAFTTDAAPGMHRILREVHGVDLLNTEPHGGKLAPEENRSLWERRSRADWKRLGRAFGATDVIVRPGWRLDLPVSARTDGYVLYAIPAAGIPGAGT